MTNTEDKRAQFNFMRSYLDSLSGFDDETAGRCILALTKYALNDEVPDLSDPVLNMYFSLIRPIVDLGRTRSNARRKKDGAAESDEPEADMSSGTDCADDETDSVSGKNQTDKKPKTKEKENKNKTESKQEQDKKKLKSNSGFAFLKEKDKEKDKDMEVCVNARAREDTQENTHTETNIGFFMSMTAAGVKAYAKERGYEFSPGEYGRFFKYNSAKGWKLGNTRVEDWRPLVDLWIDAARRREGPAKEYRRDMECDALERDLDRALFGLPPIGREPEELKTAAGGI